MSELIWLPEAQMRRIAPYFPLSHGIPRCARQLRKWTRVRQQITAVAARFPPRMSMVQWGVKKLA